MTKDTRIKSKKLVIAGLAFVCACEVDVDDELSLEADALDGISIVDDGAENLERDLVDSMDDLSCIVGTPADFADRLGGEPDLYQDLEEICVGKDAEFDLIAGGKVQSSCTPGSWTEYHRNLIECGFYGCNPPFRSVWFYGRTCSRYSWCGPVYCGSFQFTHTACEYHFPGC